MSLFDFEASDKETNDEDYEKIKSYEMEEGFKFIGVPEANLFENPDRKYDSIRLKITNDEEEQVMVCYANIPKPNDDGDVKRVTYSFPFYHNAFNLFKSTIECVDGKKLKIRAFNRINVFEIIDALNDAELLSVEVIKGLDSEYNSFKVTNIE